MQESINFNDNALMGPPPELKRESSSSYALNRTKSQPIQNISQQANAIRRQALQARQDQSAFKGYWIKRTGPINDKDVDMVFNYRYPSHTKNGTPVKFPRKTRRQVWFDLDQKWYVFWEVDGFIKNTKNPESHYVKTLKWVFGSDCNPQK